jgi:hypothetical protein
VHGIQSQQRNQHVKERFKELLRNARTVPLVHLDLVGAAGFMMYLDQIWNRRKGKRLSRSANGNQRAALNDFFTGHLQRFHIEHPDKRLVFVFAEYHFYHDTTK